MILIRSLEACFSAVILPEEDIEPVLSSTSASSILLVPQVEWLLVLTGILLMPSTLEIVVGTLASASILIVRAVRSIVTVVLPSWLFTSGGRLSRIQALARVRI